MVLSLAFIGGVAVGFILGVAFIVLISSTVGPMF